MSNSNVNQIVVAHRSSVPAGYLPIIIDRSSVFGNPYPVQKSGGRARSIRKYKQYLWDAVCGKVENGDALVAALRELVKAYKGGTRLALICHCAPKPCHGDELRNFVLYAAHKPDELKKALASAS